MRKTVFFLLLSGIFLASCSDSHKSDKEEVKQDQSFSNLGSDEEISWKTSTGELQKALEENAAGEAFFEKDALEEFYSKREFEPAWENSDNREAILAALQSAGEEGLDSVDYHREEIQKLFGENSPAATARLDLLLSDAFLRYAHDLYFGKTDPKKIHKEWGVSRQKKDFAALLESGLKDNRITQTLDNLKPNHSIYKGLKVSLKELSPQKDRELKSKKIPEGKLLKPGEKDERVAAIVNLLQEKGYQLPEMAKNDSLYSKELQAVVEEFQKERGLQTDGIIGNSTIKELNMSPAERYRQILANLERWRWYPRDLGENYILVNIANFKLAVVKDGDTIREHKVVAGSRGNQTPTFSDTLQYIVINPEWHLPSSIAGKEVIPKLKKDPGYLKNHNMKVYANGSSIDASNIDWSSPEARNYRLVQAAGPSNPLGRIKLIYPNKYLIYLHDTPAQSLFSQNQRAASHGCVRVENTVELAAYVLEGQEDWNEEKIQEVIESGKTTKVKIHRPIQVHHFYWTAWRDGGKTIFSPDVYDLDKRIYTQLVED